MPVVNKSSKSKESQQERSRVVFNLQKEQAKILKGLMKEWLQINKDANRSIDINENLSVSTWIEDTYFFCYENPRNVKDKDLNYDISFYVGAMTKKDKKKQLSNIEELLFAAWNELDECMSSTLFESCIQLEPLKGELIRKARTFCDYQIKLEDFFIDLSTKIEGGKDLLNLIKSQSECDIQGIFDALIKGDTIEIW